MTMTLPPIRWTGRYGMDPPPCLVRAGLGEWVAAREPVMICAACLYPLAEHDDGRCLDILGELDAAYRFLPLGQFAESVIRDVSDSWGEHLYVFTVGGMWEPPCYTVRGDTFGDAWEWFLDYCATRDLLATVDLDDEMRAQWERGEGIDGAEMVDGFPDLYDVSDVNGWEVR